MTYDNLLSTMTQGEAVAKSDLRELKLTLGECRKLLNQLKISVPIKSQPLSFLFLYDLKENSFS